jgi:hypothetical protein
MRGLSQTKNVKGDIVRCLVQERDSDRLHGRIKLPGVSLGAVPLISINSEALLPMEKLHVTLPL